MNVDSLIKLGRRLVAPTLLDVGTHYVHSLTSDGRGGHTDTWTAQTPTIPCRVVGVKDQLASDIADVLQGPGTAVILVEYGTVLGDQDRFEVNSTTYQIGARLSADSTTTVIERYVGREV